MGQCLKCGKETKSKAVFCDACLEMMNTYPIKPGTVAHILPRPAVQERKTSTPDQDAVARGRIQSMRRSIRLLTFVTILLSVLLMLSAALLMQSIKAEPQSAPIGRNYTTTHNP